MYTVRSLLFSLVIALGGLVPLSEPLLAQPWPQRPCTADRPALRQPALSSPDKLNWAATAGLPDFALAGFLKKGGVEMHYVAYRDFNAAIADLREGRIDVVSTALTQLLPHHQAGKP